MAQSYYLRTVNGGKIRLINGNYFNEPYVVYMPFNYICTNGKVCKSPFTFAVSDDWSRRQLLGRIVRLYSDSNTEWMNILIRKDGMILLYRGEELIGTVCK